MALFEPESLALIHRNHWHCSIRNIHYTDGSEIKWSWHALTKTVSTNGFVDRETVNKVLGYKTKYSLRAFEDKKSGLKKISEQQFNDLLSAFSSKSQLKERAYKPVGNRKGGESKAHLDLKNRVAEDPSLVLNEEGLSTYRVEYPFPSGDRADIVLRDRFNRVIGVEVELRQDESRFEGVLQAIKYRFMLAYMFNIDFLNTRAMLVAHEISEELKKSCDKYNVEYFEVN